MLIPLLLRERQGEKLMPWSSGATSPESDLLKIDKWGKLFISFKKVVLLPNTLLVCLIIFVSKGALTYIETMLPIFSIQELGWNNVTYSNTYSTSKLVGGIIQDGYGRHAYSTFWHYTYVSNLPFFGRITRRIHGFFQVILAKCYVCFGIYSHF
ncbi:MAG: hypothetical protein IPO92_13870 [Saprospiraceae bacterium]|nr:hypothetical protein [Saprospiraceae bacterium]